MALESPWGPSDHPPFKEGVRGQQGSPKVANSVKGQGKAITLAKQARRDTTPPTATRGPDSVNSQPVDRGP